MRDLSLVLKYYSQAFKDIWRRRPFFYVVIPGILTGLVLYLLYYFSSPWAGLLENWFIAKYPFDTGSKTIKWIVDKFSILLYIGGFIFLFKYILFIVMSPFMSLLSEDIEHDLSDAEARGFSLRSFISDIVRGIRITIRNVWRELLIMVVLFLLSFIPGMQLITGPLIFLTQAYYAGFGNMDYTLERYCTVSETSAFVRRHRLAAMANGSIFLLLLSIPVLGWFLAVPLGASAATRAVLDKI